jgi:phosphoenolpyruvate-protein phosphotransferase (PTS system enzyme I)
MKAWVMRSPHEITGYPAADGVFQGPVYWLDHEPTQPAAKGSADEELAAFQEAVEAAAGDIRALSLLSPAPAADLLEVQISWLEDPELLLPVRQRIQAGQAAATAWRSEIEGHASAIDAGAFADIRDIEQRVLNFLVKGKRFAPPKGAVLAGEDISPTQFLETDWSEGGAILLERGSALSHAAILARGRGVPMIVGAGSLARDCKTVLVDGASGRCVLDPDSEQLSLAPSASPPAATSFRHGSACKQFELLLNINSLDEFSAIQSDCCDGIGLVRSEFLFGSAAAVPDEHAQANAYSSIVKWAKGKPVAIRLFDLGGDKTSFGLETSSAGTSANMRGIHFLLRNRDVLIAQLRALLQASKFGDLRILLPMVSEPEQLSQVRHLLFDLTPDRQRLPALGVMVEVPEVARHPNRYGDADFLALGTNDLTRSITGRTRNISRATELSQSERTELFELITCVVNYGKKAGKAVHLCGDLASDLSMLDDLLELGLHAFSVPPLKISDFSAVRQQI